MMLFLILLNCQYLNDLCYNQSMNIGALVDKKSQKIIKTYAMSKKVINYCKNN